MNIRHGKIEDLKELAEIEALCFPAAEAATEESLAKRLAVYPECFWILEKEGRILSFVNGMCSSKWKIEDRMFEDPTLHEADGVCQMLFGVNTRPDCRKKGYAGMLLRAILLESKERMKQGVVLTCKKELVSYYAGFGFHETGLSESVHGGAVWYDMECRFL